MRCFQGKWPIFVRIGALGPLGSYAHLIIAGEREGGMNGSFKQVVGYTGGTFAALWTPCTSDTTATVLLTSASLGIGRAVAAEAGAGVSVASGIGRSAPMQLERVIQKGEKVADIVNEAKALTFTTGNEHAIVTLANGQRALVSGGPGGINFAEGSITRIFGHTHPTNAPPSAADASALRQLGQSKQYVYHGGQKTIVRSGH